MVFLVLFQRYLTLFIAALPLVTAVHDGNNFPAFYGSSPNPFKIDVRPGFIAETLKKVALTRYTRDIMQPDLVDGPPKHNVTTVRNYWVDEYDWFAVQDHLNERYVLLCSPRSLTLDAWKSARSRLVFTV